MRVRHFAFERGYRCSDCAATRLRSLAASAIVTPGFSRADRIHEVRVALRLFRIEPRGRPRVDGVAVRQRAEGAADVLEAGREDADDGPALRVEAEGASDDGGIGVEAAAPETIAQDDDAVIGPRVILVKQRGPRRV